MIQIQGDPSFPKEKDEGNVSFQFSFNSNQTSKNMLEDSTTNAKTCQDTIFWRLPGESHEIEHNHCRNPPFEGTRIHLCHRNLLQPGKIRISEERILHGFYMFSSRDRVILGAGPCGTILPFLSTHHHVNKGGAANHQPSKTNWHALCDTQKERQRCWNNTHLWSCDQSPKKTE